MKKILFLLAFVLGCVSVQAQSDAQAIKVYKNDTLVKTYYNIEADNDYKVVVGNGGDGKAHEVVDLGLSVKWATCNVGADSPYGPGSYFSWADVSTKRYYSSSTDKYDVGKGGLYDTPNFSKYNPTDGRTVLDFDDDAATVNWGLAYRTPTKEEFQELLDKCTWTLDTEKNGYLVTATNGNSIFLPATGCYLAEQFVYSNHPGYYWTSTLDSDNCSKAYQFFLNKYYHYLQSEYRCYGYTVRPVAKQ